VPLGSLEGSKDLPTNKALPVVLVCASGARSARAVGMLKKLGHERAVSLAGGLPAWREANLPIERSKA
jgi:rhodanese-related sulfurtransferase